MNALRALLLAAVAVTSVACSAPTPPPAPVDCPALFARFDVVSGNFDYFVSREGALGPNATLAFDQMASINATVQESCTD